MKATLAAMLLAVAAFGVTTPAHAQGPRSDAIWARTTDGAAITLDGVLNEPAWALAESTIVRYGINNGLPGSGWKIEGGFPAQDSTYATLKFLVVGNQLYLGAHMHDKSIGGSQDFNRFDGLLMDIKNHQNGSVPAGPNEYLYSWWYPGEVGDAPVGQMPSFKGVWAAEPVGSPRDSTQIANWDALTIVNGIANSDTLNDDGYWVEMRFNLTPMGYNVAQVAGDVVEWNVSIYDMDWAFPLDFARYTANRTWWQDPWGNDGWYGEVRIHSKPSVTIHSGAAPLIQPELRIPNAGAIAAPVIDGQLTELVWAHAPSFDIRYGDTALRQSYPGVGRWRAGQYQPPVSGGQATVVDPGDATVKYFFKGNWLYLGFDVRDAVVQYHSLFDRWDGFLVSINDRGAVNGDNVQVNRRLSFQVGPTGQALAADYLPFLRDDLAGAQVALALKPGTTVDTLGLTSDQGYTAELALDLTKLGYPSGLGDGVVSFGIDLLDGDSFIPFTDSYGTRTWWYREREAVCCPVWAYLDPASYITTGVGDGVPGAGPQLALLGNSPNPFKHFTTIRYTLPQASAVSLEVYDVQGRMVHQRALGLQSAGERSVSLDRLATTGVYLYRLRVSDPSSGASRGALSGKLMFME